MAEFDKSWDYVPELIGEARSRGLLTPTVRGRGGGSLTQRAWLLLGRHQWWKPEQLEAARLRDEPFRELTRRLEAGEITAHEWGERLDQLMKETFGDPGDSIQVNPRKD